MLDLELVVNQWAYKQLWCEFNMSNHMRKGNRLQDKNGTWFFFNELYNSYYQPMCFCVHCQIPKISVHYVFSIVSLTYKNNEMSIKTCNQFAGVHLQLFNSHSQFQLADNLANLKHCIYTVFPIAGRIPPPPAMSLWVSRNTAYMQCFR